MTPARQLTEMTQSTECENNSLHSKKYDRRSRLERSHNRLQKPDSSATNIELPTMQVTTKANAVSDYSSYPFRTII